MFLANGSKCPRNENELASTAIKVRMAWQLHLTDR